MTTLVQATRAQTSDVQTSHAQTSHAQTGPAVVDHSPRPPALHAVAAPGPGASSGDVIRPAPEQPVTGFPRPAPAPRMHDLLEVLARAQHAITEAALVPHAADRYLAAQLAAQQVAGVVLAARGARLGAGPQDPWGAVAAVAPECGEWASYFAATQPKRRAVAAGVRAIVSTREADDLVRDAQGFHDHVARLFARCHQRRASGRCERTAGLRDVAHRDVAPGGD